MKTLLVIAFIGFATVSFAQDKTFNAVLKFNTLKQFDKAQAEIDKLMADPKNQSNAEGWLWKARIYSELYYDAALAAKYPGAAFVATEAFKKYEALDPSYKLVAAESWRPVDLVYVAGFNSGKKFFEEKKWDSSFAYFENSAYMGEVIVKNNVRRNNSKLDTLTTIYTGFAAQNAKKNTEAVKYYMRLADNRIGGTEYRDIYPYMLVYFSDNKDAASFNKYLAVARELYPVGDWDDYEVDFLSKAYTLAQKAEMYDKEDAAGTLSARKYLLFGQMFTDLSKEDKSSLDSAKQVFYHKKAVDAFKKAYNKDNTLGIAAFNAGVITYNEFGANEEKQRAGVKALQEINSNKPVEKDPKKKAAADAKFKEKLDAQKKLNAEAEKATQESADAAIEWLEKAFNAMKEVPKKDKTTAMCLNRSVDYLASIYEYKMNRVRGKDPKAFDALEAKFKVYDALHDTFKADKNKE